MRLAPSRETFTTPAKVSIECWTGMVMDAHLSHQNSLQLDKRENHGNSIPNFSLAAKCGWQFQHRTKCRQLLNFSPAKIDSYVYSIPSTAFHASCIDIYNRICEILKQRKAHRERAHDVIHTRIRNYHPLPYQDRNQDCNSHQTKHWIKLWVMFKTLFWVAIQCFWWRILYTPTKNLLQINHSIRSIYG